MTIKVYAVDKPHLDPWTMPDRFRHEITYFMSIPGETDIPKLPENEYWIRLEEAKSWFEEGVFRLVSPLDSENRTEIELSEEQEDWLQWMIENGIEHVRLQRD